MAEEIAEKKKAGAKELAYSILIAVGLALIIRTGVVQAYYIPSGSMEDSLLVGDYLFANKFIYGAPLDIPFTDINFGSNVSYLNPVDAFPSLSLICICVFSLGT